MDVLRTPPAAAPPIGRNELIGDIRGAVVPCPTCAEPVGRVSAITMAVVVVMAVVLIYTLVSLGVTVVRRAREGFVSPRAYEVCAQARELFAQSSGGGRVPTYSEYKTAVPAADPVQYADVRSLWEKGDLSPRSVQKVL